MRRDPNELSRRALTVLTACIALAALPDCLAATAAPGGATPFAAAPRQSSSSAAAAVSPRPSRRSTAAASANLFNVWEYRILGNHVLPVRTVERAVYPFLGPRRDIDSVKAAAAALEKAYKDAGYGAVYVDIPVQEVDQGVVRLKVTEGVLERVRVSGARYFSDRQIIAELPALKVGEPPHLPSLQHELTALNAQTTDRAVTPILEAGSMPGTMDVNLAVKDQLPLHASVTYDDRHTANTTPNRLTATVSYDNLWQEEQSLALEYQTAPADPKNVVVESATYLVPYGASNDVASVSFIRTRSNVLALGTLGVLGSGDIYSAQWQRPLPFSSQTTASLVLGAAYKDVDTEVFPDTANTAPAGSGAATPVTAPVKYIDWSGTYAQSWRLPLNTFSMSVGVNFGVEGLENHAVEFENARYDASPSYLYFRLTGEGTQSLPAGFALAARFSGQWADSPLVNNEQFSLGGLDTVRGYLEAEALGDSGAAGGLELHLPDIAHWIPSLGQLYAYGFVDAGVAALLDPLSGQSYKLNLWSTGGGLRFESPRGFTGALDYAIPEENGTVTQKGDSRVDFSIRYGF